MDKALLMMINAFISIFFKDFRVQTSPASVFLESGVNITGVVTLTVSQSSQVGTSGRLSVRAIEDDGTEQTDNRDLVVTEDPRKQTDSDPPTFYTLDIDSNCNQSVRCKKEFWHVDFEVEDYQSGVRSITIHDDTMATLLTENYDDGQEITNGCIKINCCRNKVTVVVEDVTGNIDNIEILYPEVKSKDKPHITSTDNQDLSGIKTGIYVVGGFTVCLFAVIGVTVFIQFYNEIRTCVWVRQKKKNTGISLKNITMRTDAKY